MLGILIKLQDILSMGIVENKILSFLESNEKNYF